MSKRVDFILINQNTLNEVKGFFDLTFELDLESAEIDQKLSNYGHGKVYSVGSRAGWLLEINGIEVTDWNAVPKSIKDKMKLVWKEMEDSAVEEVNSRLRAVF